MKNHHDSYIMIGEHGIGTTRRDQLVYELGENAVDMMRCLSMGSFANWTEVRV